MASRVRRPGLGDEAAWNEENKELTREEFQVYVEKGLKDGIEPMKLVVDIMRLQKRLS